MILAGTLESTTLGDLFGGLYRARASGSLELHEDRGREAGRCHRVEFREGRIAGVATPLGAPRLGELLQAHGLIDDLVLARVVERAGTEPGAAIGWLACVMAVVSESGVRRTLRTQRSARLEALFGVSRAQVRFHPPRPAPRGCELEPISPLHFLHGRLRARETARRASEPRGECLSARDRALQRLSLAPEASPDAIRAAFRRLASRVHPDRFVSGSAGTHAWAVREFAELSRAYHTLAG